MKIAIIGASGFVGRYLTEEAVSRGHAVTGIVRDAGKLEARENLRVVACDVLDEAALAETLAGYDAVISAFKAGAGSADQYEAIMAGTRSILAAVRKSGVKRLIFSGGAGSLEVAPGVQLVDTPEFPAEYKAEALAAREALNILRGDTDLDWTFVSPAIVIAPGERTGKFRITKDAVLFDEAGESRISTQDYAVAVIDEAEQGRHIRQRFGVAY